MAYLFPSALPSVSLDPADIDPLIGKPLLGNDLEWSQRDEPTVFGISDGVTTVSVPWEDAVDRFRVILRDHPATEWVGHSFTGADLIILKKLGIDIPLDRIQDTIIWHWLVNMHLCKAGGKDALEEDAGGKRGRGFMNLWTMLSLYTNFPHYKTCRGVHCIGPCPEHDKFGYNGLDALGPVLALPKLKQQAQLRGVDKLYPMHRELAWILAQMQDYGVRIDVPYVYGRDKHPLGSTDGSSLDEQFRREKEEIEHSLPFNPKSPKAVVEYFKEKKIALADNQEETIRELVDEMGREAPEELVALLEYKELGNGVDRWFLPEYRDKDGWLQGYLDANGFVHPRLNFFTSSARLMCSSPNFQNVLKRRLSRKLCVCGALIAAHPTETCRTFRGLSLGKRVRQAIIAPEGWYIVRADLSNAENRLVLHQSGYQIARDLDLHAWVRDMAGITEDMEISIKEGNARNAAKSIQHANNILEGLQLKDPVDLTKPKMRAEIAAGARLVYRDWTFRKKVVTFTGVNLARRCFGDASWENRKKALDISKKYFERFPGVREFQKRVSKQCETEMAVRPPNGYVLISMGSDEDRMKTAQGVWQQQPIAHTIKHSLIRLWRRWERDGLMRPVLSVHDENLAYVRNEVPPTTAMQWIQEDMEVDLPELNGLLVPAEPSYGPNWRAQQTR